MALSALAEQADEGKVWLEQVGGDAIRWITRELTDPVSLWDQRFDDSPEPPGGVVDPSELPEGLHQQLHEQIYRNWADEPIPALGNLTPRQALAEPDGRRQVIRLLESYDRGERKDAVRQGRSAVDYGFLWKQLGLEREERK